jgi:hypothetical protein
MLVASGIVLDTANVENSGNALLVPVNNSGLTTFRFGWFTNYGQSTAVALRSTASLAPGTYTLTAALRYNTTGADAVVTRRITLTVIDEATAITRALAEVKPATIQPNGFVTNDAANAFKLNNETSILGVGIQWGIANAEPGANPSTAAVSVPGTSLPLASLSVAPNANQQQLSVQRNYTDQKFLLRGTLVRLASGLQPTSSYTGGGNHFTSGIDGAPIFTTGTSLVTYELTVRANTTANVQARILKDLAGANGYFQNVKAYIPLGEAGSGIIGSGAYRGATNSNTFSAVIGSGISKDEPAVRYEFVGLPDEYYAVPAVLKGEATSGTISTNPLSASGASYYVLVRTSGTTRLPAGAIYTIDDNGEIDIDAGTITDIADIVLDGDTTGVNDVPFLLLNARTGQVAFVDPSGFNPAATARQEVSLTIALRVLKSTDANPITYQVNDNSLRHTVVIYRDPS